MGFCGNLNGSFVIKEILSGFKGKIEISSWTELLIAVKHRLKMLLWQQLPDNNFLLHKSET